MSGDAVTPLRFCRKPYRIAGLVVALLLTSSGCYRFEWWIPRVPHRVAREADCAAERGAIIMRRYLIMPGEPRAFDSGPATVLSQEIASAVNAIPGCNAVLVPHAILHPGPPCELVGMSGEPLPMPDVDEILVISVSDFQPYRPMRVGVHIERISPGGFLLGNQRRTYRAPDDGEPLGPHPFNNLILKHPPPVAVLEDHELTRLSPTRFLTHVAGEFAHELAAGGLMP